MGKESKKAVKVDALPGEIIYKYRLRNALATLADSELDDDEKILMVYFDMRPLEEFDFNNGNPVLKELTNDDDELIRIFYKDMCDAIHVKEQISFRTKMSVESATFVIVALALTALDKKVVKKIMEDCGVSFEEFGKKKALENFIAKCRDNGKPIIKLRRKERKRLEIIKVRYRENKGLQEYLKLSEKERETIDWLQDESGKSKGVQKYLNSLDD